MITNVVTRICHNGDSRQNYELNAIVFSFVWAGPFRSRALNLRLLAAFRWAVYSLSFFSYVFFYSFIYFYLFLQRCLSLRVYKAAEEYRRRTPALERAGARLVRFTGLNYVLTGSYSMLPPVRGISPSSPRRCAMCGPMLKRDARKVPE